MDGIETLKQWVMDSDNIVFFGGAGVSTESGIPDFRSVDGLYNQKYDYPSYARQRANRREMRREAPVFLRFAVRSVHLALEFTS